MSKDVFDKYTKKTRDGFVGGVPTESEVVKALRVKNILLSVLALVVVAGLTAVLIFFPVVFWITARIVGMALVIVLTLYGFSKGFDLVYDTTETLRRARQNGVLEDE